MSKIIEIKGLTKDYGNNKGIFNIDMQVDKGEIFGFLGPNGAGKTTTIRHLLGFITPNSGSCSIFGMDCFKEAAKIHNNLGYLAGEMAFFEDMSGKQLLDFVADLQGVSDKSRMDELIEMFELDTRGKLAKMSKGMKQKMGIVLAFMSNPDVLILDEPTSGLDPLMQKRFVELVLSEKNKGRTILMSSHIFEEIEKTCDKVAIIKEGKIVAIEDIESLKAKKTKQYVIHFSSDEDMHNFISKGWDIVEQKERSIIVSINKVDDFIKEIAKYPIIDLDVKSLNLEELFLHYYGGENA